MPPKATLKKDQLSWLLCEKCKVNITSVDRDKHQEDCPIPNEITKSIECRYSFVRSKKFYSTHLCEKPAHALLVDEFVNDLGTKYVNNFVFISESVMSLCDWLISDFVIVQPTSDNSLPAVRMVWPITDKNTSNVFVTDEELRTTWRDVTSVTIAKLPYHPPSAAEIKITPVDPKDIDRKCYNDLSHVIAKQLFNKVLLCETDFTIEFFNKRFSFHIQRITGRDYSNVCENIEEKLKALSLNDMGRSFYLVTRKTRFEIVQNEDLTATEDDVDASIQLSSIGGLDDIIAGIKDSMNLAFGVAKPMQGMEIPRAILLYGLPGCGKSLLCDALAANTDALIVKINASEIFSKYFGETEANLLQHFDKAFKNYPNSTLIVIEEIVNVCAKENKEDSSKRVSSAFLNALDRIHSKKEGSRTFLLATTSNIENINPAVRRSGRFGIEIDIPVPNPNAREDILTKMLNKIKNTLTPPDVKQLANFCHGFVGADLSSLISKSVMHAISRDKDSSKSVGGELTLTFADIQNGLCHVKPSAMKEVLIESPNVKWTDIGGQHELKLQLKQAIEWPLTHPETFTRMGITPPRGVLMFGPPGCSKTMIAKALATESKVNFLSIKGPELFSMWVGESERAVRDLFRKARQVAPAIIFFDEIDAIGGERSTGSSVKERVLAQMLTEMDGVNVLNNVTIVAATNRPDLIDSALMRPGRIDRIVYVKLPDAETRTEIFRIKLSEMPLSGDVSIESLVEMSDGYSGAEIQAICQEAAMFALEDDINVKSVEWKYFVKALNKVKPRTSPELLKLYDDYANEKLKN